ncbi:hypothetical protein MKW94_008107 [Papaver nudicaule]|uniref:Uncharacterized protein n=1 Tax=Papaver nudicaule TaxID=74823 RepID=A0AA41SAC2_PAPNU|nr:hypothetical protein [Papaver nudicaule]
MPGDMRSFFGCASDSKTVYIAGGHDQKKNALRSVLAYDVCSDVWVALPDMARRRDECRGLVYGGKLHVIGGYRRECPGDFYFHKSAETFNVDTGTWNPVEEGFVGADKSPKKYLFDCQGNMYKSCSPYLERLYGSTWHRFVEFPDDVRMGPFVTTWGETRMVVIGSKNWDSPLNCYALVFGEHEEKCGWTKLEMSEQFMGPVAPGLFGCTLQL